MTTPKDVLRHEAPTKNFLCPLSANEYGIEFLSFVIQDYDSKKTIFEVSRDRPLPIDFSMHGLRDPPAIARCKAVQDAIVISKVLGVEHRRS